MRLSIFRIKTICFLFIFSTLSISCTSDKLEKQAPIWLEKNQKQLRFGLQLPPETSFFQKLSSHFLSKRSKPLSTINLLASKYANKNLLPQMVLEIHQESIWLNTLITHPKATTQEFTLPKRFRRRIIQLRKARVQKHDKKGQSHTNYLINPLFQALKAQARSEKSYHQQLQKDSIRKLKLAFLVDKKTPYQTVAEAIYTAAQAEFSEFSFASCGQYQKNKTCLLKSFPISIPKTGDYVIAKKVKHRGSHVRRMKLHRINEIIKRSALLKEILGSNARRKMSGINARRTVDSRKHSKKQLSIKEIHQKLQRQRRITLRVSAFIKGFQITLSDHPIDSHCEITQIQTHEGKTLSFSGFSPKSYSSLFDCLQKLKSQHNIDYFFFSAEARIPYQVLHNFYSENVKRKEMFQDIYLSAD